eukprot:TRINITY_DN28155_c0_g1_i1.p1 TRINITY_DN28155_c0_g1~~TRINITY_DN28155_c0_g1_i1.p1  ORF type:complete len:284 (+),score=40.93 TRINITY_DN28155_c0_g1_i1:103-954(+)
MSTPRGQLPGATVMRKKDGRMRLGPVLAQALAARELPPEKKESPQQLEVQASLAIPQDKRYRQMATTHVKAEHKLLVGTPTFLTGAEGLLPRSPIMEEIQAKLAEESAAAALKREEDSVPPIGSSNRYDSKQDAPIGPRGSVAVSSTQNEEQQKPGQTWQGAVDRSLKRLMIDFDLTDYPQCRLNHLDRMSDWFALHGHTPQMKKDHTKKPQEYTETPSFITVDRTNKREQLPAGSTHNVQGTFSETTELLFGMYSPRNFGPNAGASPRFGVPMSPSRPQTRA